MSILDGAYFDESLCGFNDRNISARKEKTYRWLNRSTPVSYNLECGKCHYVYDNIPQVFPYCPMCGIKLAPPYKRNER